MKGKHSFPPRGKNVLSKSSRGHYDFTILNEEFYNQFNNLDNSKIKTKNRFERLSSKDVDINKDQKGIEYVKIVIRFKYMVGTFSRQAYDFDIFKLNEAEEVKKNLRSYIYVW